MAHLADVMTTRTALSSDAGFEEVNPIADALWDNFGTAGLLAMKAIPLYLAYSHYSEMDAYEAELAGFYCLVMGAAPSISNFGELLAAEVI